MLMMMYMDNDDDDEHAQDVSASTDYWFMEESGKYISSSV